jgi:hypothetical protein
LRRGAFRVDQKSIFGTGVLCFTNRKTFYTGLIFKMKSVS